MRAGISTCVHGLHASQALAHRRVSLSLSGCLQWRPLAAQAEPNILLLIADDFGVDVARFYPLGPRQQTTPPPPPMPNLQALARQGVLFTRVVGEPVVLADAGADADRPLRLPHRDRARQHRQPAAAADAARSPCPRCSPPPSAIEYVQANLGKWHLSSGENDPAAHGWKHYAGGHPDLGHLPSYFSWPKTVDGVTTTSTVYATTDTVDETLKVIAQAKAGEEALLRLDRVQRAARPVPPAAGRGCTPRPRSRRRAPPTGP